ncbi:hypothetical protein Tco_0788448 [Tanacetum coccineum]
MECSSCRALYNKSCGCSKGGLVDKFVRDPNKTPDSSQRPPQDYVKCGNPVKGPLSRMCSMIPICYDDDDDEESSIPLKDIIISGLPPCVAITPVLSTEEPVDSLIMEDEHLDTIPETESDEFIKSSVENLVQNPSESEDASDGVYDLPICDDFPKSHLVSFSNPLFDINDDCTSSDDESTSEEDVPMENFKIFANPLFDIDEEILATEVNLIQNEVLESITSIPPGIDSFDAESNLIESLPNRNTSIDPSSKIDSLLDEFAKLLTDDSLSLPKHEYFHFESDYDPSSPRPPAKPPDDDAIEPDTGLLTTKVDCPNCDDSRARGFVLRSLDLHILSFIWESNILILSTNVVSIASKIFTSRAFFKSSQQQLCSRLGKETVSGNMYLCCGTDTAYGLVSIRRILDKSVIAVEIDFTWSFGFVSVELGRLPEPLSCNTLLIWSICSSKVLIDAHGILISFGKAIEFL